MITAANIKATPVWEKLLAEPIHPTLKKGLERMQEIAQRDGYWSPTKMVVMHMEGIELSGGLSWHGEWTRQQQRDIMLMRLSFLACECAQALRDTVNENLIESDQVRNGDVFRYAACVLRQKNADYGSSVYETGAFTPDMSTLAAALVRLGDKYQRLKKLSDSGYTPQVNESKADTILDVLGYCGILFGMNLNGD